MFITPSPVFDASVSGGADNLGNLPEWDLNDLYQGTDDPKIDQDLAWLESECAAFAADYEGKLAELNADDMLTCIQRNEKISTVAGRIMSFAGLRYYQLTTDGERTKFLSDAQEKITVFTTPLIFFTLELNRLSEEALTALFDANADLARYRPAIRRIRALEPLSTL